MDQSAFRHLLAGQTSSSSSTSQSRSSAQSASSRGGAFGGSKQRLGIGAGAGGSRRDYGIPEATSQKSSVEQFLPRQHKVALDKGKGKAPAEEDKLAEPSYKRYGYTDRASMRRAGLDKEKAEAVQEERRPKGLDLSKLDPLKRQLLGIDEPVEDELPPEEPMPLKTEEEVERELAEAEAGLQVADHASPGDTGGKQSSPTSHSEPPQKKQKRSRAEMLRDLQAKIAASAAGATEVKTMEPTETGSRKKAQKTAAAEPAVAKGFKVIERAPEKKKKKKVVGSSSSDPSGLAKVHPEDLTQASLGGHSIAAGGVTNGDEFDDDEDIFGGAGDYDDGLSADEASAKEGEQRPSNAREETEEAAPMKYFDDQDEIIPKFETWRSPTPPPRQRTRSPAAREGRADSDEEVPQKLQRLEGFSTSQYSARELLEMDNALAREEKRKLKKLKGKDKKEAMERLAELEGGKSAEQKEKDRLNKEAQEYENYEKKKQKRSRPDA